ncbi:hypothetical protein L2D01_07160 [Hyphomonadaceae bacterium ML37]|nr:hypothetical protein L2D01_07160 [Hyphomonadaceae bacterium ML37]
MSGAADARTAYQLRRKGVTLIALLIPMVAAVMATAMVAGLTLAHLLISMAGDQSFGVTHWSGFAASFALFSGIALIWTVAVTYVTASPLMAAAWMLAHGLGWRAPRPMALTMAAAGLIYGTIVSSLVWGNDPATAIGGGAGLVSGFVTGLFISTRAYERVSPDDPESQPA